jgi:hypothetical protein
MACRPLRAPSHPLDYRPGQVTQVYAISTTGGSDFACGPLPAQVVRLADLAPSG